MALDKQARANVAAQLTKVADLLERSKKAREAKETPWSKFAHFKNEVEGKGKKIAELPSMEQQAILNAPISEVQRVTKDVEKIKKEVDFMMPAMERLDTRLRSKLGLPEDSAYLEALNDAANALVDLSYKLEDIAGLVPAETAEPAPEPMPVQ